MMRRDMLRGAALLLPMATAARAQAPWPGRPIALVSPWAPGGTNDLLARMLARQMAGPLGQPVVVENRPGASGTIGTGHVARSPADGYVITLGSTPNYTTAPVMFPNLTYDPARDFAAITLVATVPNVLVVRPSLPVGSVAELIAHAKANPGKLSYSSVGKGSTQHLSAEMFSHAAGIEMLHVPYNGTAPAMQDLVAGRIDLSFENMPPLLPQIEAGAMRAIGVTTLTRAKQLPDVPTIAEQGMPGYEAAVWYALFAPAGTPAAVIARLNAEARAALAQPALIEQLDRLGATPRGNTPEEMQAYLKAEQAKWLGVIRQANIRPD